MLLGGGGRVMATRKFIKDFIGLLVSLELGTGKYILKIPFPKRYRLTEYVRLLIFVSIWCLCEHTWVGIISRCLLCTPKASRLVYFSP